MRSAEEDAAALFAVHAPQTPREAIPLSVPYPPFSEPPLWEQEGFGWWAEAFEREHARRPNSADYHEFRLAWALSGEGQLQWSDADWEAFYYARRRGLDRWVSAGRIDGPMSGRAVLERVHTLNAEAIQLLIDERQYQAAVDLTVQLYDIDVSHASQVYYDPSVDPDDYAHFDPVTRTLHIGPMALVSSPGELASTISHEAFHARQQAEGRHYWGVDDNGEAYLISIQGGVLNELEGCQP